MALNSLEKGHSSTPSPESKGVVLQPLKAEKMQSLLEQVDTIISESHPAKPGEQWSGSGAKAGSTGIQPATKTQSWRDQAIAALPTPQIMQKLQEHIHEEINVLRRQASRITDLRKPGAAHRMTQLQAKIHQLSNLLSALFEASMEALKRIFVRVFIDKQSLL